LAYPLYKNEHRIFKPAEATIKRDYGKKKKNRGYKPIWVILHTHMEMSQGNSLCSYLKQRKCHFFSFTKLENRRAELVLPGYVVGTSGRGRKMEKVMGR
jgi:hypothetical protein